MYAKASRGFRPSCKNGGASALRGFCPTTITTYHESSHFSMKFNCVLSFGSVHPCAIAFVIPCVIPLTKWMWQMRLRYRHSTHTQAITQMWRQLQENSDFTYTLSKRLGNANV